MLSAHLASFPLYFRPATLRCVRCSHEWDEPKTRGYAVTAVVVAALIVGLIVAAIAVVAMCQPHHYPSIFPNINGCF